MNRGDNYTSSEDEQGGWVSWFCSVPGHEFFVEVDDDYIRDNFNLYGLRNRIQYYDHALEMILMNEAPDEDDLQDADFLEVYRDAQDLYGLIHARFIISPRGLNVMRSYLERGIFGTCPRALCERQYVLPIGTSDELRVSRVKTYCPKCEQLYATKSKFVDQSQQGGGNNQRNGLYSDVDGAYFGTSFPHIFCLTYPSFLPIDPPKPFVPKLFGFKVHKSSLGVIEWHLERDEHAVARAEQIQGHSMPFTRPINPSIMPSSPQKEGQKALQQPGSQIFS